MKGRGTVTPRLSAPGVLLGVLLLGACDEPPKPAADIRPVRTIVVEPRQLDDTITGTGEIHARTEWDLGFRIDGKMVSRRVDVGATAKKGQELARLDDADQRNALRGAQADLSAAEAQVAEAQPQEARQRQLLPEGDTTRARYEAALSALRVAEARRDGARANLQGARDRVAYAVLTADDDGVVTAVGAEAGQIVRAGQMIVRLAKPGEKDAVFAVPEGKLFAAPDDPQVEVALLSDPRIKTMGRVRELAPVADPVTRTFTVRIALPEAPETMLLGSAVVGRLKLPGKDVVYLPPTAVFQSGGKPAVWVVDAERSEVRVKPVSVLRYEADSVVVSDGLAKGDRVVTAGVQKLAAGQKVRLLDGTGS